MMKPADRDLNCFSSTILLIVSYAYYMGESSNFQNPELSKLQA